MFNPQNPEALELSRQRKLADMLTSQGLQAPQGQTVAGGIYVPPNPMEYISKLYSTYVGTERNKELDTKELAYAKMLRDLETKESSNILRALQGTPEVIYDQQAGPMRDGGNIPQQIDPAVAGSAAAAYAEALRGQTPAARSFIPILQKQLTQEPIWEKTSIKQGGQEIQGVYDKRNPNVMATFRPYNASADIPLLTAQYSGIVPQGNANQGAPLSVRNNNPGNLVAPNGQFQQFPNQQAGQNALINDLSLKVSGQSPAYKARFGDTPVTPSKLAEVWSPASAKGNSQASTTNYGAYIAQKLGINPNDPIPNNPQTIARVGEAITEFERGAYGQPNQQASQQPSKYDLEVPKQFNTPKERDEWFAKSREPLTGEPLKMVTGAENTIVALRDFSKGLQNFNKADLLNPDKVAEMTGLSKNAFLALKDAKGLGVLNKEDLPQLEAILRNPADIKNILNSKDLFQKLADRQIGFASNVVSTNYKNSYKQIPENTKQKLNQIDLEVAERQQAEVKKSLDKPLMYTSPESVETAGKAGRIQDGQLIIIGNQKFRYKKD